RPARGRLDDNDSRTGSRSGFPRTDIRRNRIRVLDCPSRRDPLKDLMDGSEKGAGCEVLVPAVSWSRRRRNDGRHPGRQSHTGIRVLEDAQFGYEFFDGGIGESRIDVSTNLAGEERTSVLGVVKCEA